MTANFPAERGVAGRASRPGLVPFPTLAVGEHQT
jgi:hypothetical protein